MTASSAIPRSTVFPLPIRVASVLTLPATGSAQTTSVPSVVRICPSVALASNLAGVTLSSRIFKVVTASSAIPRSTVFPFPIKVASVLTLPPVPLAMSFATVQAPRPALRVSSHLITCPSAAPFWFRSSRVIVLFTILSLSIVLFSILNCPILFMVTSPPTSTGVGSLAALPTKINPSSNSGASAKPLKSTWFRAVKGVEIVRILLTGS